MADNEQNQNTSARRVSRRYRLRTRPRNRSELERYRERRRILVALRRRNSANAERLPTSARPEGSVVAAAEEEGPQENGFHVGESSQQGRYMAMLNDENGGESSRLASVGVPTIARGVPIFVVLGVPTIARGVPIVGALGVVGREPTMEDALSVRTSLCMPAINRGHLVHFFGVFDGHGGAHVAMMCKDNMHAILEEELMSHQYPLSEEIPFQQQWTNIFNRCFARVEMKALNTCLCGSIGFQCNCGGSDVLFKVGSTAVVVVLTQDHIVAANCGDSRALLCSGGRIVRLTFDHKPDRVDERARIEACGGSVFLLDTPCVQGVLAMSRAIGDAYLKPAVTSEPEVTLTRRTIEDEFLIIASDGLWDVIPNEMACGVVRECLRDTPCSAASAAVLLTRLALARGSSDNISIIVVDLKRVV